MYSKVILTYIDSYKFTSNFIMADILFLSTAYLRVTVDGGTNSWYRFSQDEGCLLPDFVTGDFDSVEQSILSHYRNLGVSIVCTPDQNHTDFTKAVLHIVEYVKKSNGKVMLIRYDCYKILYQSS